MNPAFFLERPERVNYATQYDRVECLMKMFINGGTLIKWPNTISYFILNAYQREDRRNKKRFEICAHLVRILSRGVGEQY